jgi:hypothetical protein
MSPAPDVSQARQAANERNAQLSTGPRTQEGKQKIRLNGLRHGLTGQMTLMPWEDRAAHDKFCKELIDELAPEGKEEALLANSVAEDHWRLNRIRAIEENIFALGCATVELDVSAHPNVRQALLMAQTFLESAKSFNLLSLYESRINRTLHRNRAELTRLKTARLEAHQKQLEEAALLAEANKSAETPYDPAADGFAFSAPELARHIDRTRRLAAAKTAARKPVAPVTSQKPVEKPGEGDLASAA